VTFEIAWIFRAGNEVLFALISDSISGWAQRGRQFSKLGFTVQLVPRYALLVRDQGRAREEGRINRTILTQSRGCERHAAPLRSAPRRAAPHVVTAPVYYAGLCSSSMRCERPRLDSIRLDSTRAHTTESPVGTWITIILGASEAVGSIFYCQYFDIDIIRGWGEWSVTESAGRAIYIL